MLKFCDNALHGIVYNSQNLWCKIKELKNKLTSLTNTVNNNYTEFNNSVLTVDNKIKTEVSNYNKEIMVNVKDFGAKGDYFTDDTESIKNADIYAYNNGKTLFFPDGQYSITSSVEQKSSWIGMSKPSLGTFPLYGDDKIYLKYNTKFKLKGTSIFIKNSSLYSTINFTSRNDLFSSFTYAICTNYNIPVSISNIAIILDIDIYTSFNELTTENNDNSASCDIGYLINDTSKCYYNNITLFGYFNKAGLCILTQGNGDNPDYNYFNNCSFMGYYGVALLGSDNQTTGAGLSGTQFIGCQIFANDYHYLDRLPHSVLKSYQDNGYGHCLFIDGNTGGQVTDLNGTEFIGGNFRTYSNLPIKLDNASNVHFTNTVFEFPSNNNDDTKNTVFYGTSQTRYIQFSGCRNLNLALIDNSSFGDNVQYLTITNGHNYGDLVVGSTGNYICIRSVLSSNILQPRIEFTKNTTVSTEGNYITCNNNVIDIGKFNIRKSNSILTITNNSITPDTSYNKITYDIEQNLTTINGTFSSGQILILEQALQSKPITIEHGSGNIRFGDGNHKYLNFSNSSIVLIYNGTYWVDFNSSLNVINRLIKPINDNTYDIGSASYRFKDIYCSSDTINTSDEREKTDINNFDNTLLNAWKNINFKQFKFNDSVDKKGELARIHAGLIAQQVKTELEKEGLDPFKYGVLCYDEWKEESEIIDKEKIIDNEETHNEDGSIKDKEIFHYEEKVLKNKVEAGNCYSIRYEEALCLEAAYQRWRCSKLEERLTALENKLLKE